MAETIELRKRDANGVLKDFLVADLETYSGPSEELLTTAEKQKCVKYELDHIRALPGEQYIPGYPTLKLHTGQNISK